MGPRKWRYCDMFERDQEREFSLNPVNFFQISADCLRLPQNDKQSFQLTSRNYHHYLLPNTSSLCVESPFAEVALGWSLEGLEAFVNINEKYQISQHPQVSFGDSVELFIDTRDVKTSGYNTRFCHHFFFLPESIEGVQAGEITRFRTEDTHELCNPKELVIKGEIKAKSYQLQIFIPSQCLYGYDPDQFDRLGFSYRINRFNSTPQHFSVTSDDYQIEQQPSLWSSLRLVK